MNTNTDRASVFASFAVRDSNGALDLEASLTALQEAATTFFVTHEEEDSRLYATVTEFLATQKTRVTLPDLVHVVMRKQYMELPFEQLSAKREQIEAWVHANCFTGTPKDAEVSGKLLTTRRGAGGGICLSERASVIDAKK